LTSVAQKVHYVANEVTWTLEQKGIPLKNKPFVQASVVSGLAVLLMSSLVMAHSGGGNASGFASGFLHPAAGLDHIVAMIAVGLWGAWLGAPAIWLLPVVFPMVMALGGVLGILGIPVPAVELVIALSAIVLGICVGLGAKPKLWIAALLVAVFAIFHGYAHGAELPGAQSPVMYCIGFVLATGLIHLTGIGIGFVRKIKHGDWVVRSLGAGISVVGVLFLPGVL
jgi:urease accessory protein